MPTEADKDKQLEQMADAFEDFNEDFAEEGWNLQQYHDYLSLMVSEIRDRLLTLGYTPPQLDPPPSE